MRIAREQRDAPRKRHHTMSADRGGKASVTLNSHRGSPTTLQKTGWVSRAWSGDLMLSRHPPGTRGHSSGGMAERQGVSTAEK